MNFRLLRMISINSYSPERIAEFWLDGHINLNGENGAGKTTLLRLLPIFFGEKPSKLLQGNAINKKFGAYYFPTQASYVIFEYQRRDQKVLAVMHAEGSSDKVVYRFINSEYKPELFNNEKGLVLSGDLYLHLSRMNIICTRTLTREEYKSILQNTASRENRQLAAQFSFCSSSGKIANIERIVTSVFEKETTFYDLKRMVVSSIREEEGDITLGASKDKLTNWLNDYNAHQLVASKQELMGKLEDADNSRKETELLFEKLHARFLLLQEKNEADLANAQSKVHQLRKEQQEKEQQYSAKNSELTGHKVEWAAKAKEEKKWLDSTTSRRDTYQAEQAEIKVAQVEEIPALQDQLKAEKEHLDNLTSKQKSVADAYAEKERAIHAHALSAAATLTENVSLQTKELTLQKEQKERELSEFKKALEDKHEKELEGYRARVNTLQLEQVGIQAEFKHAAPDIGARETLEKVQKEKEAGSQRLMQINDELLALERESDSALREFQQCEAKIKAAQTEIAQLSTKLEQALKAQEQESKSLAGFLKTVNTDWTQTFGRVLSDSILMRTDLEPNYVAPETSLTVFGLELKFDKLPMTNLGNSEHFAVLIATYTKQRDEVKQLLEQLGTELGVKSQAITKANQARDLVRAQKSTASNELQTCEQRMKLAQAEVQQSKKRAEEAIQKKINEVTKNLEIAKSELTQTQAAQLQHRLREEKVFEAQIDQIKQDRDKIESNAAVSKLALEQEKTAQIKLVREEKLLILQSGGISSEIFSAMSARIEALNQKIKAAEDCRNYVANYTAWLKTQWKEYPQRQASFEEAQEKEKSFAEQIAKLKEQHLLDSQEIDKSLNDLINEQNKLETLAITIRAHYHSVCAWPVNEAEREAGLDPLYTLEALAGQKTKLSQDLARAKDTIREGVGEVLKAMKTYSGSGPDKYITQVQRSADCPRENKEQDWLEVFRVWYGREQTTHETSIRQIGETMAQDIDTFRRKLLDFKQKVSNFNAELSRSLSQGKAFEGVSDLQVDARTKLEGKDYWDALQAFGEEYEQWHSVLETKLPPQSFVTSMKRIAEMLSSEKNLTADLLDLLDFSVRATIDGIEKRANNENEFLHIDSTGRSYIVLCLILIGFVNRIRQKEQTVVPFIVDELKTLSNANIEKLLKLLSENNLNMVCAFPDLDIDLAEHFVYNYRAQEGRKLAQIKIEENEVDYV